MSLLYGASIHAVAFHVWLHLCTAAGRNWHFWRRSLTFQWSTGWLALSISTSCCIELSTLRTFYNTVVLATTRGVHGPDRSRAGPGPKWMELSMRGLDLINGPGRCGPKLQRTDPGRALRFKPAHISSENQSFMAVTDRQMES